MESNDRRQRQSNSQSYPAQHRLSQQSQQYAAAGGPDRLRQSGILQSPTTAAPHRRAGSQTFPAYGYGEGAQFVGNSLQGGALQYQPDYTTDPARPALQQQQASNQYGQYASNVLYNVQSQQQQQQAPSPSNAYAPVQNYQQHTRQAAPLEVLPSQFTVPQQYYVHSGADGVATSAPTAAITNQAVGAQYATVQYSPQTPVVNVRNSLGSTYAAAAGMPDGSPIQQESSPQYDNGVAAAYSAQQANNDEAHAAYAQYQLELRKTNERTRDGRLAEAGTSLVSISQWLLSNVESLGLIRDDESAHAERLQLWEDFNHCWLAVLTKQKRMTVEAHRAASGRSMPTPPQGMLDNDALWKMGGEIVRLCDGIEKHGLVDYQMGVWEEEILEVP